MRRIVTAAVLSVGLIIFFTPAVSACINDRETMRTETEFKSRYNSTPAQPGYTAPGSGPHWQPIAAVGLGMGLMVATVGMVGVSLRRLKQN